MRWSAIVLAVLPSVVATSAGAEPHDRAGAYLMTGFGVGPAPAGSDLVPKLGPTIAIGYRRSFGRLQLDLNALDIQLWPDHATSSEYKSSLGVNIGVVSFAGAALHVLHSLTPEQRLYAGCGLGYGMSFVELAPSSGLGGTADGVGFHAAAVVGYERKVGATTRMFVEASLTAPLYRVRYPGGAATDGAWAPTLQLSVGAGFGS